MKSSLFKEAMKIAVAKIDTHPERKYYMHYSFIVQNNKIIAWATNTKKEPPLHYGYHSRIQYYEKYPPKTHSEIQAYKRARGILGKNYFEIINIRLNQQAEVKISKPCPCCYEILSELGCRRFYYSSKFEFLMI